MHQQVNSPLEISNFQMFLVVVCYSCFTHAHVLTLTSNFQNFLAVAHTVHTLQNLHHAASAPSFGRFLKISTLMLFGRSCLFTCTDTG
jgi:hypothetical protein